MKLPRVLLLATTTGYQTRAFGDAAETLGVELVFATDRCDRIEDPWRDGAIAIRFHEEEHSIRTIVAAAERQPVDGLIVVGDRPTVVAARVAEQLRLPYHSPDAALTARDKLRTRQRLGEAGLPVPWVEVFSIDDDAAAASRRVPGFPCVVKPVSLSGSRGVIRADDRQSFVTAFERLRVLLWSAEVQAERNPAHHTIIAESFIPGREFAVEGLMHEGRLQVLAIFDKPDPLDGPFFEETIYLTPSRETGRGQEAISTAIGCAAAAIGLSHGPVHAECRVNAAGVFVLEVAARPIGGLCARALRFADGNAPRSRDLVGLESLLLRHALGESGATWRREEAASGVMMIPIPRRGTYRAVEGLAEAAAVPCITDVRITARSDQLLLPLPEGASYLGFIFARAATAAAVDRALRGAHAQLRFRIDPQLPVFRQSDLNYNQSHG
jgi:ATP-grasp domain-containing protein/L-aminoacid ligase-like protein